MTRDFNKPRRDTSSFRNSSPNRNRDERSPRPARTRLNRAAVDRAWESGAQQQHADYRPRTGGGQARPQGQRNNSWNNSSNNQGYSSGQNGRNSSRPYNNNRQENFRANRSENYRDQENFRENRSGNFRDQENFRENRSGNFRDNRNRRDDMPRDFDRPSGRSNDYRPARAPYGQERRNFGDQRPDNRRNSFEGPNRRGPADRPQFQDRGNSRNNFGDNDRPYRRSDEQRFNDRGQERNFNRRYSEGNERFQGDYEQFEDRDARRPRFEDQDYRDRPSYTKRPSNRRFDDRDSSSPRSTRDDRFDDRDTRPARPTGRPFSGSHAQQARPDRSFKQQQSEAKPEKHVTPLPDGRVLKGPRPAQRKNAQFWKDISADMNELLAHIETPTSETQAEALTEDGPVNTVSETSTATDSTVPETMPTESSVGETAPVDSVVGNLASAESPVEETAPINSAVGETTPAEDTMVAEEQPDNDPSETPAADPDTSGAKPVKRRTRAASTGTRTKTPRPAGSKPSQRGFKWPTQE